MKSKRDTMKKATLTIICAALLSISGSKPAVSALIIDPAAIAQNINGTARTIYDMAMQDILQNGMLKQLQTQGFSLAFLKNLLNSQLGKYAIRELKGSLLKPQVKSTKEKETELLSKERDLYTEAAKANVGEKLKIAKEEKADTETRLMYKRQELIEKQIALNLAKAARERVRGKGGPEEVIAVDNLEKAQSEYNKVLNDVRELEQLLVEKTKQVKLLQKEEAIIGTSEDPKWQNMNKRVETLESEEEDTGIIIDTPIDEEDKRDWAKLDDVDDFNVDGEKYKKFIEAYFYEPSADAYTDLHQGKALQDQQQEFEAKQDKILRQRKYLVINTAAHLLQVSGTIRREKPMRESVVKVWFDQTLKTDSEIIAITAYSNTRIESSRALLLYARLLAAKMQYNAAKEINGFPLEKYGKIADNDYSKIDLGKYVLTVEEIIEALKNSSMGKVIQGVLEAEIAE